MRLERFYMKRLVLAGALIASVALMAAACGDDNPTSPSTSTPAPSPTPTPAPAPAPAPAPVPAPFLASLSVDPSVFDGGRTTRGTATLDSPALTDGQVVTLSSSEPANATPPASITIPAGSTTGSFDIPTRVQTTDVSITLTGSAGGQTRTALMRLRPRSSAANNLVIEVNSDRGGENSNQCWIRSTLGQVDCLISVRNAPGNAVFTWTFTTSADTETHEVTGNDTTPEQSCAFLDDADTSEDDTGKFFNLSMSATYITSSGATGGPVTKTIKVYPNGFCGY
jgi:hypothetical protein